MRAPRTFIALFAGLTALTFSPALADEAASAETVEVVVDLDASAQDIYLSIREQAWTACKADSTSSFMAARNTARRACQKALISDVVSSLAEAEVIQLAERDGIRANS